MLVRVEGVMSTQHLASCPVRNGAQYTATADVVVIITVSCPWKPLVGRMFNLPLTPTGRLKGIFSPPDTDPLGCRQNWIGH